LGLMTQFRIRISCLVYLCARVQILLCMFDYLWMIAFVTHHG
jgi:hypothetical protein